MSDTSGLPTVITAAGLQPQAPAALNAQLIAIAQSLVPGLTGNLPGSLIDDVAGTGTAAVILADQARVELVNSLTPLGANDFLLLQLGAIYGCPQGQASNNSVYVVFSTSPSAPGFVINAGFTVSDGAYQYVVQDGGVINSDGSSQPLFTLATVAGSWAIPAGTVTQLVTSVPGGVTLSVSNPLAGLPGAAVQTAAQYRSQVLRAGLAVSQGMTTALKTALQNVPGVQANLISVRAQGANFEIIVGGGDPYQVAYAIFTSLFWIAGLVGSTIRVTGISVAANAVVTTDLNHGLASAQVGVQINGVVGTMAGAVNGASLTIVVITPTTFSIGVTTTGLTYTSGGVVTPNSRNVVVSITDYPDVYDIPIVIPPQQTVEITLLWNTTATNLISTDAVAAAGSPALVNYVNGLSVGQPMNLFQLQDAFKLAVAPVIPPALLTRMVFTVTIDGVSAPPATGTGVIAGDPESYFYTDATMVSISQG